MERKKKKTEKPQAINREWLARKVRDETFREYAEDFVCSHALDEAKEWLESKRKDLHKSGSGWFKIIVIDYNDELVFVR